MKKLRAAILGCGSIAHTHVHALLELSDQVELVAFCSHRADQAHALANEYTPGRASVFTDHHEMFARAGLDLVIICLPPFAHTDEIESASTNGIHILIEKPI